MLIVGVVSSQEEAFELEFVSKVFVVARRFSHLGEMSKCKNRPKNINRIKNNKRK